MGGANKGIFVGYFLDPAAACSDSQRERERVRERERKRTKERERVGAAMHLAF